MQLQIYSIERVRERKTRVSVSKKEERRKETHTHIIVRVIVGDDGSCSDPYVINISMCVCVYEEGAHLRSKLGIRTGYMFNLVSRN